jgi:hypothetical protein
VVELPEGLQLLLSQGPVGLVAALFVWLYLNERKENAALRTKKEEENRADRELHYKQLDAVRQAQINRESEIAQTLDEYGRSVVTAVEQTSSLAKELRSIYARRDRDR